MDYRIPYPLWIRTTEDQAEELTDRLCDLRYYTDDEPYFGKIFIYIAELKKAKQIRGIWRSSDMEKIIELAGAENVKIGETGHSLQQTLAEMETAILSEREEHERGVKVREMYDTVLDHREILKRYGYNQGFDIIHTQTGLDRNITLSSIDDSLHEIKNTLKSINITLSKRK